MSGRLDRHLRVAIVMLFMAVGLGACTDAHPSEAMPSWLLGTWVSPTSKGDLYETWIKADGDGLRAKSYYLEGLDTVLFETVELKIVEGKWNYIVSAPEEQREAPVPFVASTFRDGLMVFDNPGHPFPNRISYQRVTPDSILAEVSGMVDGKEEKERFTLRRK